MGNIKDIFGGEAFDAEAQDAPRSFEPIPAGSYRLEIQDAEVKATTAGNGQYLKVELAVIDGEYEGRRVFCNFNLQNPSAEAERIGREQFGALCRAAKKPKVSDANELLGLQFEARVKIRPARDGYNAQNEIDPATCKPLDGTPAAKTAAAPASRTATQSSGAKTPPWASKGKAA